MEQCRHIFVISSFYAYHVCAYNSDGVNVKHF